MTEEIFSYNKETGSTYKILKKTCQDIGKSFSERSDAIANIYLDESQDESKQKAKAMGKETVSFFKDLVSQTANNLKEFKLKDIINDTSHSFGKMSGIVKTKQPEAGKVLKDKKMDKTQKELYYNLGKNFYEWYKQGEIKFIYGTDSRHLEMEIGRMSELIEYVKTKKSSLEN